MKKMNNSQLRIMKYFFVLVVSLIPYSLFLIPCSAQQTPQYTQYLLNNYGMNPAAAGTSNNRYEALIGLRRQWIGFTNPPQTAFLNFTSYFGRKGGGINYGWHGVGFCWQGDKMGSVIKVDDFLASYSYLIHMMRKGYISFGMAAGAKRYGFRMNYPTDDPVMVAKNVWLYPDLFPGIKFWNTTWSFDLSVKNLYKYRVKQGSNMVGSPAMLPPHFYFTASQRWWPRSYLLVVQSVCVKYNFATFPSVDYNALAHLNKNFAVGLSYRNFDAVAAVAQFRFDKLVVGLAFDYSIAPYRVGFANTQEFMLGIAPSPFGEGMQAGHYRTAECPQFQY